MQQKDGKMVASCGMTRTSHCALHLRARAEHMNNTNAHTTHSPYGIAGVRSSTIKIVLVLWIWLSMFPGQMTVPFKEGCSPGSKSEEGHAPQPEEHEDQCQAGAGENLSPRRTDKETGSHMYIIYMYTYVCM